MNNDLMSKVKVVGLMLMLGLLLFCAWKDVQRRTELNANALEAQDNSKEEEEQPQRVVDPDKPMIALTFDDGPSKFTMQLLEQLNAYGAKATFFLVGENIDDYPDTIKKMQEIGCEFGNHTMNHARLTTLTDDEALAQIQGTNAELQAVINDGTKLLRPPYGSEDERIATISGSPLIMWSVDTNDWENKDATAVREHVLNVVKDGDVVLMHDIHETTVQAAIELIPQLIEQGYQLVTISEMAEARGVTMESGVKYYQFKK